MENINALNGFNNNIDIPNNLNNNNPNVNNDIPIDNELLPNQLNQQELNNTSNFRNKITTINNSVLTIKNRINNVADILKLVTDFSVNKTGENKEAYIFSSINEAKSLDKNLVDNIITVLKPDENNETYNELKSFLNEILTTKFSDPKFANLKNTLSLKIDKAKNRFPDNENLRDFLDTVNELFNKIIKNKESISNLLNKGNIKELTIPFNDTSDIIGLSAEFPEDALEKNISAHKVNIEDITNQIRLGEKTLNQILESEDGYKYRTILNNYSKKNLNELREELNTINSRISQNNEINDIIDINNEYECGSDLKLLNDIITKAHNTLSEDDFDNLLELGIGAEQENNHVNADLNQAIVQQNSTFSTVFGTIINIVKERNNNNFSEQNVGLINENKEAFLRLFKATGFDNDFIKQIIANKDFVTNFCALCNSRTSDQIKDNLNKVYANLLKLENSYSVLFKNIINSIDQSNFTNEGKIVFEHLTAKLEKTSDALRWIQDMLPGNQQFDNPSSIDYNNLKAAYKNLYYLNRKNTSQYTENDKNFIKEHSTENRQRAELELAKIMYHMYMVENPSSAFIPAEDPQPNDNPLVQEVGHRERQPLENQDFWKDMLYVITNANQGYYDNISNSGACNRIRDKVYNGYNPLLANYEDTPSLAFVMNYNIMMTNTNFLEAIEKLPKVHLVERFDKITEGRLSQILTNNEELAGDFNNITTQQARVEWFFSNIDRLREASRLITVNDNTNHTTIIKAELSDNDKLDAKKIGLQDLYDFVHKGDIKVGEKVKELSTLEDVAKLANSTKGSIKLANMTNAIYHILADDISAVIPNGGNYYGLSANDFLNPRNFAKIQRALNSVPAEEHSSLEFKLACKAYIQLFTYTNENIDNGNIDYRTLKNTSLANIQKADFNALLTGLNVTTDHDKEAITNFCRLTLQNNNKVDLLKNLNISEDMFAAENNIFVADKKAGAEKFEKISTALKDVIKDNCSTNEKIKNLLSTLNNELAGSETLKLTKYVGNMSQYYSDNYQRLVNSNNQELPNPNAEINNDFANGFEIVEPEYDSRPIINDIFSKNIQSTGNKKQLLTVISNSFDNMEMMSNTLSNVYREVAQSNEVIQNNILKNNFAQILIDNSLREVAYTNGFETFADFKLTLSRNKGSAKLTKDQLIDNAADNIKDYLGVSKAQARIIVLKYLNSDIHSVDQSSTSVAVKRNIRRFGRILRGTSTIKSLKGFFSGIGNYFKHFFVRKSKDYSAVARNTLLSIEKGQYLTHSKNNKLFVGVGMKLRDPKETINVKLQAGGSISSNNDLKIEHLDNDKYVFTLGGKFAIGAEASGGLMLNKVEVASVKANIDGNLGTFYKVTVNNLNDATTFLDHLMNAQLKRDDFKDNKEITKGATIGVNAGIEIGANLSPLTTKFVTGDNDVMKNRNAVDVSVKAKAGADVTWTTETNIDTNKYSKHSVYTFGVNANAKVNVQNILINNEYNKIDNIEDNEKRLIEAEKKVKTEQLALVNTILGYAFNPLKTAKAIDNVKLFNRIFDIPDQSFEERRTWDTYTEKEKYEKDPKRAIANAFGDLSADLVLAEPFKDIQEAEKWCIDKLLEITKIKDAIDVIDIRKYISDAFTSMSGPKWRTKFDMEFGNSLDNVFSVSAEAKYTNDHTLSFTTSSNNKNLLSVTNDIKVTTISTKQKDNKAPLNDKCLEKIMKRNGCTEDEIFIATNKLNSLLEGGSIDDFTLKMKIKPAALIRIQRNINKNKDYYSQFKSAVSHLKEDDFEIDKIVFHSAKGLDSSSSNLAFGLFVKAEVSSTEKQTNNTSYTISFAH